MYRLKIITLLAVSGLCCPSPVKKTKGIAVEDVTFLLCTRENPSGSRVITGNASTLENTSYDPKLPTKLLVHGWMDDINCGCIQDLKKEFLELEPMNIIAVGWPECSHTLLYEQAVECAQQVGTYMGELIKWLSDTTGLPPSNVHALGHSIGGHIVSFISRVIPIPRISAFDPAAPLFQHADTYTRIDSSDATFVEAFHTSTLFLGMKTPVAHIDFFPNGGERQPGCNDIFGSCAHGTSYKYYAHTIPEANRQVYAAFKCESTDEARNLTCTGEPKEIMGYGASKEARGIYYLDIPIVP